MLFTLSMIFYFIILPSVLIYLASGRGPATATVVVFTTDYTKVPNVRTSTEQTWYDVGNYGMLAWFILILISIIVIKRFPKLSKKLNF